MLSKTEQEKDALVKAVYAALCAESDNWVFWIGSIARDVSLLVYCILHDKSMTLSHRSKLYKLLKERVSADSEIWKYIT